MRSFAWAGVILWEGSGRHGLLSWSSSMAARRCWLSIAKGRRLIQAQRIVRGTRWRVLMASNG